MTTYRPTIVFLVPNIVCSASVLLSAGLMGTPVRSKVCVANIAHGSWVSPMDLNSKPNISIWNLHVPTHIYEDKP
jgi:hypothetical protein